MKNVFLSNGFSSDFQAQQPNTGAGDSCLLPANLSCSLIQGLGISVFSQPTSPAPSLPRAPQNPRIAEGMGAESSIYVVAVLVAAHAAEGGHSSDDGDHSSSPGLAKFCSKKF